MGLRSKNHPFDSNCDLGVDSVFFVGVRRFFFYRSEEKINRSLYFSFEGDDGDIHQNCASEYKEQHEVERRRR